MKAAPTITHQNPSDSSAGSIDAQKSGALTAHQAELVAKVLAAKERIVGLQAKIADIKSQMAEPLADLALQNSLNEQRLEILAVARISGEQPDTAAIDARLASCTGNVEEANQTNEVLGKAILILEGQLAPVQEELLDATLELKVFIADLVRQKFKQAESDVETAARSLIDAIGRLRGVCMTIGGLHQQPLGAAQMAAIADIWTRSAALPYPRGGGVGISHLDIDWHGREAREAAHFDLLASISDATAALTGCEPFTKSKT